MSIEEQWEVEIGVDQHQTDLETVTAWIRERRIKKGELNQIEIKVFSDQATPPAEDPLSKAGDEAGLFNLTQAYSR